MEHKNKCLGDAFEKWVLKKSNIIGKTKAIWELLEWRSDKSIKIEDLIVYPKSNSYPDFTLESLKDKNKIAVECKCRSIDQKGKCTFRIKQDYIEYIKNNKIKRMFFVLGLGNRNKDDDKFNLNSIVVLLMKIYRGNIFIVGNDENQKTKNIIIEQKTEKFNYVECEIVLESKKQYKITIESDSIYLFITKFKKNIKYEESALFNLKEEFEY